MVNLSYVCFATIKREKQMVFSLLAYLFLTAVSIWVVLSRDWKEMCKSVWWGALTFSVLSNCSLVRKYSFRDWEINTLLKIFYLNRRTWKPVFKLCLPPSDLKSLCLCYRPWRGCFSIEAPPKPDWVQPHSVRVPCLGLFFTRVDDWWNPKGACLEDVGS